MKRIPPGRVVSLGMKSNAPLRSRVDICEGLRERCGDVLKQIGAGKKVLVVSQASIPSQWISDASNSITDEGFEVFTHTLPDGEECKSTEELMSLWSKLQEASFERNDTVLAIGGGAVTDVAGFAAATYLRGIRSVLMPTTLLAQVDAAIGGKTGINLSAGKNLAGAIHMPEVVLIDSDVLATLPERDLQSGMGEIVKYAYIERTIIESTEYKPGPKLLIDVLKSFKSAVKADDPSITSIITSCVRMKLAVVAADPHEKRLRRCLNLGHTLGHAIEKVSDYSITHGEGVSIGTVFALQLAISMGRMDAEHERTARAMLSRMHLPVVLPDELPVEQLLVAMMKDKKRQGSSIKFVLPNGEAGLVDIDCVIDADQLMSALEDFVAHA
ncbi:MAG: 3-dehydroquinate synthase [Candidatus Obscuribacterales bacterium]|nr:3-dehydroquinate synthase [Candidatus Obscuribacterales bacterium]